MAPVFQLIRFRLGSPLSEGAGKAEQVVARQPAISSSISPQTPFNRAGGRTSNVRLENKDMSESKIDIRAEGYFLNHLEKNSQRCVMRLEGNLQKGIEHLSLDAESTSDECVWIRIRENTPMSTGGCETGIRLSIEEADRLLTSLLEIIHYTLPEVRKLDDPHE